MHGLWIFDQRPRKVRTELHVPPQPCNNDVKDRRQSVRGKRPACLQFSPVKSGFR